MGLVLHLTSPEGASYVLERTLKPPELFLPLGTDTFGRELGKLLLSASSLSLFLALSVGSLILLVAMFLGNLIVLLPPIWRNLTERALESWMAFPSLLIALLVQSILGPGWTTLILALILGHTPSLVRLAQVRAKEILEEDYLLAAQALGASPARILWYHLGPGVWELLRVKAPNLVAQLILAETTLSFLGLGAPHGAESWGNLLLQGRDYLIEAPWISLASGLPMIMLMILLLRHSPRHRI